MCSSASGWRAVMAIVSIIKLRVGGFSKHGAKGCKKNKITARPPEHGDSLSKQAVGAMTQWQRNIHLPHSHRSTWLQFHNNPEENTNEWTTTRPSNWERLRRPWRWPRLAKGRDWGYIGGSVTVASTVVSAAVPPSPRAGEPCHLRYGCARRKVIVCPSRPPFRAIQVPGSNFSFNIAGYGP